MRNASRATPLGTQQKQQQEQTDHIITISTASLTEQLQEAPLKHYAQPTPAAAATTATAAAATATATATATAAAGTTTTASGAIAAATNPSNPVQTNAFGLCRLSQLVSYQNNIADVQHRRGRRLHGLQLPLHPLQLFGWLVLLLFGVASYWVLIPAFHAPIQGPLYGLISGLYVVHIAAHLTALLTDPADKELRRVHRNDRIVPEFDRSKHGHVIENGRCHLCNIRTSTPRTKHCSVCNKCVGKFDHHCKWLNHCIGSRNYVAFLMCVVSAVVATLVIVAAVIGQIVLYYVQPDWLSFYWCNTQPDIASQASSSDYINLTLSLSNGTLMLLEPDEDLEQQQQQQQQHSVPFDVTTEEQQDQLANLTMSTLPTLLQNFTALLEHSTETSQLNHTVTPLVAGIGVHETIYLLLLGVLGLLAAISAGLLLHLCFFHIYISFLGLTTYEYIRNHRQAQEAKAKQLLEQGKNGGVHFNPNLPTLHHPSKLAATGSQLYCCSNVPHPNQQQQLQQQQQMAPEDAGGQRLHCCASSREFHQARQALYMCSLLQERRSERLQLELDTELRDEASPVRSFHCCSSFAASAMQRRASAAASAKAALEPRQRTPRSGPAAYLQYTEQCTVCTFQLRSPLQRSGAGGSGSGGRSSSSTRTLASQTATPTSSGSAAGNISKHQRWRRKWNCCASVPDSPDVPNDLLAALSYREHASKINASELPVQFIRSLNGGLELPHGVAAPTAGPTELPLKTPRSSRLRHMLRLLGRYRRARCQRGSSGHGHGVAAAEQHVAAIKQNQIRPLQLQPAIGRGYDNASTTTTTNTTATPPPPMSSPSHSGTGSVSSSELSSDQYHGNPGNKELMLLPTSVIRDDSVTTGYTLTLPPALPPPTRRKMPNASELAELAETLGFVASSQQAHGQPPSSAVNSRQLPGLGNVYRRQRRKHFLRTRSPTLSPIHESGLSNPTSPQPLRHSLANSTSSATASGSNNNAKCSPDVHNLCGLAGDSLRKSASNSSLQSISSNSSST